MGDRIAIRHLDSCVVAGAELIGANSNYPQTPIASSVEIFGAATLRHWRSVPLGVRDGSLTVAERDDGRWWAIFANYDGAHSISGGSFGADGILSVTGQDAGENHVLGIPREGPVPKHVATIAATIEGQTWAWNRSNERTICAIRCSTGEVVVPRVPVVPQTPAAGEDCGKTGRAAPRCSLSSAPFRRHATG